MGRLAHTEVAMVWDRELEEGELEERLIYALLRPAVRLAMRSRLPMKELIRLVKIAYFQELRAVGLTLQETADALDASLPTAARLSKELKRNFLKPELEHQLPQRIEFMLWAQPLSRARLHQVLTDHPAHDIDDALDVMLEDGRLARVGDADVFELQAPQVRMVSDRWFVRIGSLNHILDNLSQTVVTRFFDAKPAHEAFARNLNLRVPSGAIDRLHRFYEEVLWPSLVAIDETAADEDEVHDVRLTFFWHAKPHEDGPKEG